MNDNHDDNENIQPEEVNNGEDTDESEEDANTDETLTTEELLDGMKLTEDSPFTYGDYRAALNDPNHHLNNPEDPQYEEFQKAKEELQESMKRMASNLSGMFEMPKIDIEKIFPKMPTLNVPKTPALNVPKIPKIDVPKAPNLNVPKIDTSVLDTSAITRTYWESFSKNFNENTPEDSRPSIPAQPTPGIIPSSDYNEELQGISEAAKAEIEHKEDTHLQYAKESQETLQQLLLVMRGMGEKLEDQKELTRQSQKSEDFLLNRVNAQLNDQSVTAKRNHDSELRWRDEQRTSGEKEGRKTFWTLIVSALALAATLVVSNKEIIEFLCGFF